MSHVLDTERLTLRELMPDDVGAVASMLCDRQVMHFWGRTFTHDDAAEWIRRHRERYATHGHGYWLALNRATGETVGQAGILTCEIDGVAEPAVGYILCRSHWGRGLATEAARGCLRWAFEERGFSRVVCQVRPENVPSLRVAARLGFWPEKHTFYAGFPHLIFAMTRERFRTKARNLR